MNEDFNTGLILLAVGMLTVFFILALIVLLGNGLIKIVNKYFPAPIKNSPGKTLQAQQDIESKKITAIVTAIDIITEGRGKVESIKKAD